MTPEAALYALHERLISDRARPFYSDGSARSVRPTPAGEAWLRDYHRYRYVWQQLHHDGISPPALLKAKFGFVTEDELPPEPEHDNGRRIAHDGPPPLQWYEYELKEEMDGPEAA